MTEGAGDGDSYLGGGVMDGKNGISGRGGASEAETGDVYGGGNRTTGVTNVGGGDGGIRLTVDEAVALIEACAEETTEE